MAQKFNYQYGPGYRQTPLGGQQAPGITPPFRRGFGPGQQKIVQQNIQQAAPQQSPVSDMDALLEALAAQQAGRTANRFNRTGTGVMWAPGNNKRNIAAGAFSSFLGDRAQKRSDASERKALELQAEADKQEKLRQEAQAEQQARAVAQNVLANGGNQQQADAAYEMTKAGMKYDMQGGGEPPDVDDYNSMQTQIEKVVGKPFMERTQAIRDIATYAQQGTGFSDHALIFRYMKFLDPASTVREGEFATVEQTGSVPERVRVAYNKAIGGDKLTDDQRQEIVTAVTSAYPSYVEEYEKRMQPFKDRVEKFNMDWNLLSIPEPYPVEDVQAARTEEAEAPEKPDVAPPPGTELKFIDGVWKAVPTND